MHTRIVNGQHVRMIERRECLYFLFEPPQAICIGHEIFGQHLHRHVAMKPRVLRTKHFAHSARADAGGDSVLVERYSYHLRELGCSVCALICPSRIS